MALSSKRLQPLIQMAEQADRDALTALGQARQRLQQAQAKRDELVGYRGEYQSQKLTAVTVMELRNRHGFLAKLSQAIDQQAEVMARLQAEVDAKHAAWHEKRKDLNALQHLDEQARQRERGVQLRREQKMMDEFAMRMRRDRPS